MGGGGRPPQLLASSGWAPALRALVLGFGERTCPGQRRGAPARGPRTELRWEPAGSAFIIVPTAPGTGWGAGRDGGSKRAVPSASPARRALAPQAFPGRLPRASPGAGSWRRKGGTRVQVQPADEDGAGRTGSRGTRARPRRALVTAPPAPPQASASRFPPPPGSAALRSASSMGKAAALCRGGGCSGRSRGLSSFFTVVPCLSCHTAAPSMSASTPGSEPEPKPRHQPVPQPKRDLVSEQESEPVFETVPGSEPESRKMSEPRPGFKQELELLQGLGTGSGPREELGSSLGAGPFTKTPSEQVLTLGPVVGSVPLTKLESGLLPASKAPRPGQVKTHLGAPVPGSGTPSALPMVSLPLDSFKGWLLKWTNYLKGYQRRWFVLSNGLLSYYRYGSVRVGWLSWEGGDAAAMVTEGIQSWRALPLA